jgi:hypothetical protein
VIQGAKANGPIHVGISYVKVLEEVGGELQRDRLVKKDVATIDGVDFCNKCIIWSAELFPWCENTFPVDNLAVNAGPLPINWSNLRLCNDLEQCKELEDRDKWHNIAIGVILFHLAVSPVVVVNGVW